MAETADAAPGCVLVETSAGTLVQLQLERRAGADRPVLRVIQSASDASTSGAPAPGEASLVITNLEALAQYLETERHIIATTCLVVLHLDVGEVLLGRDVLDRGWDAEWATLSLILHQVQHYHAKALILVQHHCVEHPELMAQGLMLSRRLAAALAEWNIPLHDHVILGTHGLVSLRQMGFC